VISTGDKDLAQLVNAHVKLVNTMNNEVLDEAGVVEKFGVPPVRIVDYLALVGDAVDNVPGVAKVGPKTAAKWIAQYGSLDAVVEHAADIGGAVGENLRRHLDFLPLGRKLVTVACDLDLPLRLADLAPQPNDDAKLMELYGRLEFRSWLKSAQAAAPEVRMSPKPPATQNATHDYETILDAATFDRWLTKIEAAPLTSLYTETTDLDPMRAQLVGISFAVGGGNAAYLPLGHRYAGVPPQLTFDDALARLKPWLESPAQKKVGQHLKYDRHIFANHGIELRGIQDDTLLESYVLESDK
jgi:DNA polymerase-1